MSTSLKTVILAAGKGTRMKSSKAKVLHEVFQKPMINHVLRAVEPLNPAQNIVVVGHQKERVQKVLTSFDVTLATQAEQLGTGHAVLCAESIMSSDAGIVMILCGDTPLILPESLEGMFKQHVDTGATLTLMTTILDNPTNYGRIVSDDGGRMQRIVEQKDATLDEQQIKEINAGIYCVDQEFLFESLKKVGTDNSQGEVYLTDIVAMAVAQGLVVEKYVNPTPSHVLGVNSRVELAQAHQELSMRRNVEIMLSGVTMYNPETITIEDGVKVGIDCTLHTGVSLRGETHISGSCEIMSGAVIEDSKLGDGVTIGSNCYVKGQIIKSGEQIAPNSVL